MICALKIIVCERHGRSYLKDVYVTPPFRVVPVGQHKTDGSAYLMVMSTSPGILSGDQYQMEICVSENARLQLQSQSYQRLYNMEAEASQRLNITLEQGSSFSYIPHPVVPHENAHFTSVNKVFLADGCELILSEIITCGRKHCDEIFRYRHFQNLTEIYHHGKLVLKDNVLLQPQDMPLVGTGLLEGFTHQGTLVYLNTKGKPATALIERFFSMMNDEPDVISGISQVQHNGFVLRVLGNGGEQMYNCFQRVQQYLWEEQYAEVDEPAKEEAL